MLYVLIRSTTDNICFCQQIRNNIRTKLFKTNNVISKHIVKTLIIKYGIYANIFTEKMLVATHILSRKIPVN